MMKKISMLVIGLVFLVQGFVQAQDQNLKLDIGADMMSRYVWRGTQFGGTSPSLQPYLSFSNDNLEFGFWGAYSLGGVNPHQEFDLYVSYTFANGMFTATLTDYFFPNEEGNSEYFNYDHHTTGHVFEGMLSFNGTEEFPISMLFAMNFHGADAAKLGMDPNSSDFNEQIGIQKSMYVEFGYSTVVNDLSLDLFAGATLSAPEKANATTGFIGESGFYGHKAGLVNLGLTASKEVKITEHFSLPVSASLITNPEAESIYFVFGISL